ALVCLGLAIVGQTAPPKKEPGPDAEFKSRVKPLLTKYCAACHAGADAPAGIDIEALQRKAEVQKDPSKWQRVGRAVFSGIMPPKGRPAP
ncbi:c-type cytochrome domain-containing protein, partial [Acinetobacter baumannii]